MKYKVITLLMVTYINSALASSGVISTQKNEMSGELTYTYFQISENEKKDYLKITCNPSGGLDLQFFYENYYYQTRCHLNYDFKFDNGPIEKKKWKNNNIQQAYAENKAFIERIASHNKIILQAFAGASTPVFDIKNARNQFKKFSHQCPIGNN